MTIKESIEKLGKKLTGKDIHGTSISDVVSKVGDNLESGSGGVVFKIISEMGGETGVTVVSAEKTPNEVAELLYKGAHVCCNFYIGDESMLLTMEMTEVANVPEAYLVFIEEGNHPCGYTSRYNFDSEQPALRGPLLFTAPNNTWMVAGQ